ncbi:hypothetical protein HY745_06965 [Candidatus Desantisbacteria bacterium]|nr:hypothetical protein [Candidatus Desantisbacteria bacterium]
MDFIKKIATAGLGAVLLTEEKIKEVVDDLVKKGEMSELEGKSTVKDILNKIDENKKFIEDKIVEHFEVLMKKANIAAPSDIQKLEKRIEKLESLLKEKNKETK